MVPSSLERRLLEVVGSHQNASQRFFLVPIALLVSYLFIVITTVMNFIIIIMKEIPPSLLVVFDQIFTVFDE